MDLVTRYGGKEYLIDIAHPCDISIVLQNGFPQVNAFFAPPFTMKPMTFGDFTGSIAFGAPVNCYDIQLNPHGNGTHTECIGHIATEPYFINEQLKSSFFISQLISVYPQQLENGDRIIDVHHLEQLWIHQGEKALIIRTLPNHTDKLRMIHSGNNPPYLTEEAIQLIIDRGIDHLLVDLPSVDREQDDGRVAAHKRFWNYSSVERHINKTITELIYVPDHIRDGIYFLNLQTINIKLDASPSRPLLYKLIEK
ncbi:MAG TPA: cyclase family protein [Saprospiraceae bacterium]|nr:cyclase family protein [Saprospiraceae bacterium]